jgi:hypothetical protein
VLNCLVGMEQKGLIQVCCADGLMNSVVFLVEPRLLTSYPYVRRPCNTFKFLGGGFEQSYYLVAAKGKKNSCMKERQ